MAPCGVPGGANWGKTILDAIAGGGSLCRSPFYPGANKSIHVANEIERAASYRKTIVPLRIENVMPSREIELHISARHWVDLFEGPQQREQNMRRFLDVLRDVLRSWLVPDLSPLSNRKFDETSSRNCGAPIESPVIVWIEQPSPASAPVTHQWAGSAFRVGGKR